jgi:hypothetical protein
MNRKAITIILLFVSVSAFIFYYTNKLPADIESKGATDLIKEFVSLAIAVLSFVTALLNFITTKKKPKRRK